MSRKVKNHLFAMATYGVSKYLVSTAISDEDIFWGEVSVEHPPWVEVGQSFGHVQRQGNPQTPRKLFIFLLNQLLKVTTVDQLKT